MTDASLLIKTVDLSALPDGGRVMVASSQATPYRHEFCVGLGQALSSRGIEVIDAGVIGEWQAGDSAGAAPDQAVLLVHHDCPHGHAVRLMTQFMGISQAAVLDMISLANPLSHPPSEAGLDA